MSGWDKGISDSCKATFLNELKSEFKGQWSTDALTRGIYSTDASHYQQIPVAVAWPRDEVEVLSLIRISRKNNIPILGRGAGTSLAGQTITTGLVIDFSRYMNKILEWNVEEKWVRVQPGVVRDKLNVLAANYNLQFAPDPATSNRATIGGMVANNSSGTRSIVYGKTIDHLIELKIATADGEIIQLGPDTDNGGKHIDQLQSLIERNTELIRERIPKVMRRVGGYPLDYLVGEKSFNPALLFCGSEGTLGIILEARIRLVELPGCQSVVILHFEDTRKALKAVERVLLFEPSAAELLDKPVLDLGAKNPETKKLMKGIDPKAGALLLVEFSGESIEEVKRLARKVSEEFSNGQFLHPVRVSGVDPDYHYPWELRKKGLGILMSDPSSRKPLAFIEDSCVPVANLPDYIDEVLEICHNEGTDAIVYAHASVGVIHVRPLLDLSNAQDISAMERISARVFDKVCHYDGAWSGEHGDGLARSYKNKDFFGDQLYEVFREIKRIFDPYWIMNPGKIVDAPPMVENLRMGDSYKVSGIPEQEFHFRETLDFESTVHLCSGVGECLKMEKGVMCPSFRATEDEEHSTRGRANALRLAISGQLDNGLENDRLKEALGLCLSCKACKTECPSNVDMARLKSQVNSWNYKSNGIDLRTRLFARAPEMARIFSGLFANWVNAVLNFRISKYLLDSIAGISSERTLPAFSSHPLKKYASGINPQNERMRVILFGDTYTSLHEDRIGRKAILLLEKLGYQVDFFANGCCQRPSISLGLLNKAIKEGEKTVERLMRFAGEDPVIVLEPGCASAFTDDLPDLLNKKESVEFLKKNVYLFEEFLEKFDKPNNHEQVRFKLKDGAYAVHGHCHHKSLFGMNNMQKWFTKHVEADILWMDSGCCGMAGAFGYEKENQGISKKIAEQSIFSNLRSFPNRKILATGFSCRHQIKDLSNIETMHWLEVLELSQEV